MQGGFDPRMLSALQNDANAGNWEEQLKSMGMTPQDVLGKIMSDPTLAQVGTQHPGTLDALSPSQSGLSSLRCVTCYVVLVVLRRVAVHLHNCCDESLSGVLTHKFNTNSCAVEQ